MRTLYMSTDFDLIGKDKIEEFRRNTGIVDDFEYYMNMAWDELPDNLFLEMDAAVDDNGNLYRNIRIRPTGRYTFEGRRFFITELGAIDLDSLIEGIKELAEAVLSGNL